MVSEYGLRSQSIFMDRFNTSHGNINSLANDKMLDMSKFKAFADEKSNGAKMAKFVCNRVENIVGKAGNAGYQYFLLFPQCFQKATFPGWLKVGIVWERVLKSYLLKQGPCTIHRQ